MTFIVGIILARLLSPEDYGLLGLIAIFTAICNSFITSGFGSALIQIVSAIMHYTKPLSIIV